MDTWTDGGVICGYWAIGSEQIARPPGRVMTMDSTDAKIGRSMKKCEIMGPIRLRNPKPAIELRAIAALVEALRDRSSALLGV